MLIFLAGCAAEAGSVQPEDLNDSDIKSRKLSAAPEVTAVEVFPTESAILTPTQTEADSPAPAKDFKKLYQKYYEQSPDSAYSVEEWLANDGRLDFPFDLREDTSKLQMSEVFTRFYVPKEALERAATEDLLRVSKLWPMTKYYFYNFPSYYLDFLLTGFNATEELVGRLDLAEVVLDTYIEDEFMTVCSFDDTEQQTAYNKECYIRENGIVLEEVLLAGNEVFDQMDDEMRQQTLDAVREKMELRQSGKFLCHDSSSGFFAYIIELHDTTGSRWYDYIAETLQDNELIEQLDDLGVYHYWNDFS
jgi:hypothetical protein